MKDLLLALLMTIPLFLEGPLFNSGVSHRPVEMANKIEHILPVMDSIHFQMSDERSLRDSTGIETLRSSVILDL